jgi:hypothetical protein
VITCRNAIRGTATCVDLCKEVKKVLHDLDIAIKKLSRLVIDAVPLVTRRNGAMSLLVTEDVKNCMSRDFSNFWHVKKVRGQSTSNWGLLLQRFQNSLILLC